MASLFSLLTYKLLQQIISRYFPSTQQRSSHAAIQVRINPPAITAQQSFENNTKEIQEAKKRFNVRQRQRRALEDFFRDTGGKVTDLRVLRSAMFLSDEIDRAVRGIDVENQYVGWRPYNRFFAEGTEDLFTNVPTGRSPLVMAAPKTTDEESGNGTSEMKNMNEITNVYPVQYQAMRQSHLKQVGRAVNEVETYERQRLTKRLPDQQSEQKKKIDSFETTEHPGLIKPLNEDLSLKQQRLSSTDLKAGVYQAYEEEPGEAEDKRSNIKKKLLRFEGEISEKRPDLDYKFDQLD